MAGLPNSVSDSRIMRVLEKERDHREQVDDAAIKFLKIVKEKFEKKLSDCEEEIEKLKNDHKEAVLALKDTKVDLRISQREVSQQGDLIKYLRQCKLEAVDQLNKLKSDMTEKDEQIKRLEQNAENLSKTLAGYETQKSQYEQQINSFELEKNRINQTNDKLQKANERLKKICQDVENQATKFQSLYEAKNTEIAEYIKAKQDLIEKVSALEDKIETLTLTIQKLKKLLLDSKEDIEHKQATVETLQHRLSKYEDDIVRLKEELSQHITTNNALNSSNKQLSEIVHDTVEKNSFLERRLETTLEEMDKKTSEFVREKMKLDETINQQLKLIDMLHGKMEKPKKAWFSLNSPKVHHGPPNPSIQLKEYEAALERERAKNKMLVKQIDETKKELRHYKNEIRKYDKQKDKQRLIDKQLATQEDPEYRRQLEAELDAITTSSGPTAPPGDFETLSSSTTTDNNETSEEDRDFTFSDSILAELGDRKISNIEFAKEC